MRRSAPRLDSVMAYLTIPCKLLEPAAGRRQIVGGGGRHLGIGTASTRQAVVVAAASPGGEQPQDPSQPPRMQQQGQAPRGASPTRGGYWRQQRRQLHQHPPEFDRMRQGWNVESRITNYPESTQQVIRSGAGRGSRGQQARPNPDAAPTTPAVAAGGGASSGPHSVPPGWRQLAADLEKLDRVLAYERQLGFTNVEGSSEKVPMADWARRHLMSAVEQLQGSHPDTSHQCFQAAKLLFRYSAADRHEREAAVAAAEQAARQARACLLDGPSQQQQRQQQQQPAAPQQARQDVQPLAAAAANGAPVPPQAANGMPVAAAGGPSNGAAAFPAAAPTAGAAYLRPQGPTPLQPLAAAANAVDLDAAAAEAYAEENLGERRPTPEGVEYVMHGNRRVKASTVEFRRTFAEAATALAAAAGGGGTGGTIADLAGGEQKSAEWFKLRENRLTASAFANAVGLFRSGRMQLWEEKVGLLEPFAGNAATQWGSSAEPQALQTYQAITGQQIASCMFQVRHDDPVHGWLGASPDGLIESLSLEPPAHGAGLEQTVATPSNSSLPESVRAQVALGDGPISGAGRGILEIKCPWNKGHPEHAVPPPQAIWYYMPQVQGLMYIFDCEWCNLYIWTPNNGSAVYHVRRDRAYWAVLWEVLADFWWSHVVPARHAFEAGRWEDLEQYRPTENNTPEGIRRGMREIMAQSKRMAEQAPATFFRPQRLPPQQ